MSEAVFRHTLHYPDNDGITIRDIANTLLAQEKLLRVAAEILETAVDGLTVERVQLRLEIAETGSLTETLLVAFFVVYQTELTSEVPELIEALTGLHIPERYDTLATLLFLLSLLAVGKYVVYKIRKDKSETPAIQGDYNTYLNITAKTLSIAPERLEEIVTEKMLAGRKARTMTRAAIDLFRPAKRNGNGRIQARGVGEVSSAAVGEFPSEAALTELDEAPEVEPFPDVEIEIRATDRDKRGIGWAGIIRAEGFKRMPMRLYPTIDTETLAAAKVVRGDVLVEYRQTDGGEPEPERFHLLALHGKVE